MSQISIRRAVKEYLAAWIFRQIPFFNMAKFYGRSLQVRDEAAEIFITLFRNWKPTVLGFSWHSVSSQPLAVGADQSVGTLIGPPEQPSVAMC